MLADDGAAPNADACTPILNDVAGKIVLVDRGVCAFTIKVKFAQDAGAIAVIAADNVAGSPPAGLGGADPTIIIPSGRVTLADGNTLKANLGGPLDVTLGLDMTILAGTDRVRRLMLVATFDPVATGSSISHFDGIAFPNQLMEPAINSDLTSSIQPPEDLTLNLMTDIGWFSDGDGVPDGADACLRSDVRETVFAADCDTKAANDVLPNGCSVNDLANRCDAENPQMLPYLGCMNRLGKELKTAGVLTGRERAALLVCSLRR